MYVAVLAVTTPARPQLPDTFFASTSPPAVDYTVRPPGDPIAHLNRRLETGELALAFEGRSGYLRAVLAALQVPLDSQLAVFSKTSLQTPIISPRNPRSLFFNDEVTVAWPRGGIIEVAAVDPQLGPMFYLLEQRQTAAPRFVRGEHCLTCHQSAETLGVPGLLLRSQPTSTGGRSMPWLGNYISDHRSPFAERWGGWYVTGHATELQHLGNRMVTPTRDVDVDVKPQALIHGSLAEVVDLDGYVSPYSDVVALTVFDHQMRMSNLLTRIGWKARATDGGGPSTVLPRVRTVAREVVDYLLFIDEASYPARIEGTSGFAERFSRRGPVDSRGRSLYQLELGQRLLRYPCSYMIYSEAFEQLPAAAKTAIYERLWDVLSGTAESARYARLTGTDRDAIVEILRDTKPDLPAFFRPRR